MDNFKHQFLKIGFASYLIFTCHIRLIKIKAEIQHVCVLRDNLSQHSNGYWKLMQIEIKCAFLSMHIQI